VLAAVIPYLAEVERPAIAAQALTAATATISDRSRARALAAVVPHLPAALLPQALSSAPRAYSQILVAILERGRELHSRCTSIAYVDLLRDCLDGISREVCLEILVESASGTAEVGGNAAIKQIANALADVYRWWP
jgi:hypothetical protein